jgi:fucose permease
MFGFVGDRYAQLSGTALSIVISIALVGGMLMPYAAGVLGGAYGLRVSFMLVPASLVLLATLLGVLMRRLRGGRVAAPVSDI